MLRLFKAFITDTVSWILFVVLLLTLGIGLASLVNRYDRMDDYKQKLTRLEYDILLLNQDLEQKKAWVERLKKDPTAWEQVARDKMNYLGPNEVLVTFIPAQE